MVAQLGRSDAVGRPMLYGTTDEFLAQFGFETLKDLPEISDIEGVLDETGYEAGIYSESGEEQILAEQISLLLPEKDD
ncbi:MAG: SMC-Scp complex subunit ScpB [Firmicutes bacterium]|nr:SMC-Scp complex subunit ScpB [Bacillota bacterium]